LQGSVRAALGALILSAPALAGETGTDLGSSAGINYRVAAFPDFVGPSFSSFVNCLPGDVAISGGIEIGGLPAEGRMGSSARGAPGLDGTRRTWRTTGHNLVAGTKDMNFYGVCKESGKKGIRFASGKRKGVDPGEKGTAKARCPDGYRVIGGGIISVDPIVLATVPFDGGDSDAKPDDGWKASAVNNQGVARAVRAQAICRKARAWDLAYHRAEVAINGNSSITASQLCSGGVVTGGGAEIVGPAGTGRLFSSFPFDDADMGFMPSEGWLATVTNLTGTQQSGSVHAICKV
jgi:hypothetical protein